MSGQGFLRFSGKLKSGTTVAVIVLKRLGNSSLVSLPSELNRYPAFEGYGAAVHLDNIVLCFCEAKRLWLKPIFWTN